MTPEELAYIAGIVDTQCVLRLRPTEGSLLPMIALYGGDTSVLAFLGKLTDSKVTITSRNYSRHRCDQHCPSKHDQVVSESGRWSVTGTKARVMLKALRPYLRFQGSEVDEILRLTEDAKSKTTTIHKMILLGWPGE